jgi:hypothetical protein
MDLIERLELHRLPNVARRAIERLNTTLEAYEERLSLIGNGQSDGSGQRQADTRDNEADANDSSLLVDEAEARRRLGGLCSKTIYNLRKQGLPSVKIGTRTMYDPRDLRQWIARKKTITA